MLSVRREQRPTPMQRDVHLGACDRLRTDPLRLGKEQVCRRGAGGCQEMPSIWPVRQRAGGLHKNGAPARQIEIPVNGGRDRRDLVGERRGSKTRVKLARLQKAAWPVVPL